MPVLAEYVYRKIDPRQLRRLADSWSPPRYTAIAVRPLTPLVGAEIEGVDLRAPLSAAVRAEIHAALLEWKVIFFRDQHISTEQQRAFALHWGDVDVHPFYPPAGADDIVRFTRAETPDSIGKENTWHTDVTFFAEPSMGAVLRAVEVPEVGGDTLFADMGAAYDLLSDEHKSQIEHLHAEHDWDQIFGRRLDAATRARRRREFPPVRHPVVRIHPETGRRTLFVNRPFTTSICGMSPDASAALLDVLFRQADLPEIQCRFRWTPGAVAFWDNRAVQHYAASDYFPARRVVDRISITGDRPV